MSDWEASASVVSSKGKALGVLIVAWLIPGAGHLWLGRRKKALLLGSITILTFILGILMDGKLYQFEAGQSGSESLINSLATLAGLGSGLLYFISLLFGLGKGVIAEPTFEIGIAFLLSAGLFNILTAIDAYRCSIGYDYDAAEEARRLAKQQKKQKKQKKRRGQEKSSAGGSSK